MNRGNYPLEEVGVASMISIKVFEGEKWQQGNHGNKNYGVTSCQIRHGHVPCPKNQVELTPHDICRIFRVSGIASLLF